jgi:hypothetical protein
MYCQRGRLAPVMFWCAASPQTVGHLLGQAASTSKHAGEVGSRELSRHPLGSKDANASGESIMSRSTTSTNRRSWTTPSGSGLSRAR